MDRSPPRTPAREPPEASGAPAPDGPPDTELVARARNGDTAAYEVLVRRHSARLYSLVYHMTGHREDAEDLVQSVFIRAYQSLRRFHGHSAFYTWIYRIAVNASINFLKKRRRRQALSLDDLDQAVERDPDYVDLVARENPVTDTARGELKQKLNAALQTLSDKHRAVVVMHDIEGLPHDEIARRLGISAGTVRSRLFYARQLLQSQLSEFVK